MPKPRLLTAAEAAALGLDAPAAPKKGTKRLLSPEEASALGLPAIAPDPFLPGSVDLSQPYEKKISPARAEILGGSQGATLGFGEEIGAGLAAQPPRRVLGPQFALSPDDTPEIRRLKLQALDQQVASMQKDPLAYQPLRDRMRSELAQAQKQQPRDYMAGEMAGSLLTAPLLPGPSFEGGALRNAAGLLASGAGYGAAAGLGGSNAPLGSAESLGDTAKGAGMGLGGAAAGALVGKMAPRLIRALGAKAEQGAVNSARRVMLNGAKQLGDKGRVAMPDEIPLEVLRSGGPVPFGTTEGMLSRVTAERQAQSKTYGEIIDTLEKNGLPGPNARALADQIFARGKAEEPRTMIQAIPDLYRSEADKIIAKSVLGEQAGIAPTGRLGLSQAEDIKRSLQTQARYGKIEDTPINEARMEIASMVRQANEDAVKAGARPLTDEAYLYHVTPESNAPSIRQQGLRPDAPKIAQGGPHGNTKAVFLADQGSVPIYEDLYGGGTQGLTVFRTPRRAVPNLTADPASEGVAWMTPNAIPPERLQMRTPSGEWQDVVPGTTDSIGEMAESFVPVKQRLGRLIEAEKATKQGAQRGSARGNEVGPIEVTEAIQSKSALPLAGRVLLNLWRQRGPSTKAATLYPMSRALKSGAVLMSRVPVAARMAGGAALGGAAGRALGMRPEPPAAPEPPPEGPEADFQRYLLEQDLAARSRPSAGAPLRRLIQKGRK